MGAGRGGEGEWREEGRGGGRGRGDWTHGVPTTTMWSASSEGVAAGRERGVEGERGSRRPG